MTEIEVINQNGMENEFSVMYGIVKEFVGNNREKFNSDKLEILENGFKRFNDNPLNRKIECEKALEEKGMAGITDDEADDLVFINVLRTAYDDMKILKGIKVNNTAKTAVKTTAKKSKKENNFSNVCISIKDLDAEFLSKFFIGYIPVKADKQQDSDAWAKYVNFVPTEETKYLGWKNTEYLLNFTQACEFEGFGGVVRKGVTIVDVDNHDNDPRYVEMIERLVRKNKLNTMMVKTTSGIHVYFLNLNEDVPTCANQFCACNIRCDYRSNNSGYIVLKIGGNYRNVIYKSDVIDEIPKFLKPISKGNLFPNRDKMFPDLDLKGARHEVFRDLQLRLLDLGLKVPDVKKALTAVNNTLYEKWEESELNALLSQKGFDKARALLKQNNINEVKEELDENLKNSNKKLFIKSSNDGETIEEMEKAITFYNELHANDESFNFIGFKKGMGVHKISLNGEKVFEEMLTPVSLPRAITTKEFLWSDGTVNENKGCYNPARLDSKNYEQICDIINDVELPNLPVYKFTWNGAILDTDGNLYHGLGYKDVMGGIFFTKDVNIEKEIPEIPNEDDIIEARKNLWDLFHDFNFEVIDDEDKEESMSYHNTLVMLGLAIFRPVFECPYPLCVITKKESFSGATTLSTTLARVATNNDSVKVITMTSNVDKENILTFNNALTDSEPITVIDNCNYDNVKLEGIAPLMALTTGNAGEKSKTRVYGSGKFISYSKQYMFFVNGIDTKINDDLSRRCIVVNMKRLSSLLEERHDIGKSELNRKSLDYHVKIMWSFGVFIKHWIALGKPVREEFSKGWIGEYDNCAGWIANILYTAGYTKMFNNSNEVLVENNFKTQQDISILEGLNKYFGEEKEGFTMGEIVSVLVKEYDTLRLKKDQYNSDDNPDDYLINCIFPYIKDPSIKKSTVKNALSHLVNGYIDGAKYELKYDKTDTHRYFIVSH